MKKNLMIVIATLAFSAYGIAAEKSEDQVEKTVERSSSHNPFTKTNTDTVVKKTKKRLKNKKGFYKGENTVKVKTKTSDDGKRSSVSTEETYTQEQE